MRTSNYGPEMGGLQKRTYILRKILIGIMNPRYLTFSLRYFEILNNNPKQ